MPSLARYGLVLIAGLALGWALLPTPLDVCGFYQSQSAPAWVQAVGSVVAILATAGVAWWQLREQRRQARADVSQRMRVVHQRLSSELEVVAQDAKETLAGLEKIGTNPSETQIDEAIRSLHLYSISSVSRHEEHFHELPEGLLKLITDLLAESDQLATQYASLYDLGSPERYVAYSSECPTIEARLKSIEQHARDGARNTLGLMAREKTTR